MAEPARAAAGLQPFLRIPPFPGRRTDRLAFSSDDVSPTGREAVRVLAAQIARTRVGGSFWGGRPELPPGRDVILAPASAERAAAMLNAAHGGGYADRCLLLGDYRSCHGVPALKGELDPWHIAARAVRARADAVHEFALVAALAGVPLDVSGAGPFAALGSPNALERCIEDYLLRHLAYRDPFTGRAIAVSDAVELLGGWRALIDANREVKAVFGVARWKRVTMDALLWDGSGSVRHAAAEGAVKSLRRGDRALAWTARTPTRLLTALNRRGVRVGEIEDGMIRSRGLGANCVPPLSVIADFAGAHFDPAQPSGLERILQEGTITAADCRRATRLRERLVKAGISKYGSDDARPPSRPAGTRRRVLVTGQVEDDRSVLLGGAGLSNLALLGKARAIEPDAYLIYKPHPDVEAGHRVGGVKAADALALADEIDRTSSITALIDSVDAVHVITSLAGFEALMRGTSVTTHGVPFYACWGLTDDRGPALARRSRERSLDELVAATLILYPRYLDPVTGLPCPVEVLVDRLAEGRAQVRSPLVALRTLQGRLSSLLHSRN